MPPTEGPAIILKLDDAWYEDGLLHPGWMEPESRWVEFRKIVDFLIEQNARFVTPADRACWRARRCMGED